jgi:hypothetical protein
MLEKADILFTNDARKHGNTEHKTVFRDSVLPRTIRRSHYRSSQRLLEEAVSPGSRDREGDARTLNVQEQPLAVGTARLSKELATPERRKVA